MKKKICIFFLSFSLLLSTVNPLLASAEEASDFSTFEENEIIADDAKEVSADNNVADPEPSEDTMSFSIEAIQPVELNNSVTAEESMVLQEQADAAWDETTLKKNNIRYRFVGTVLYIGLIDPDQPQVSRDFPSVGAWAIKMEEQSKAVTKVVIEEGITTIGKRWFYAASTSYFQNLTEVELPSSVTEIGQDAFGGDVALSAINLENVKTIGFGAFQNDRTLTQLSLEKAESIGDAAFGNCVSLQHLTLGQADVQIAEDAFRNCPQLRVCYAGSKDSWSNICASEKEGLKNVSFVHCKKEAAPKEATCTEPGTESLTCEICEEVYAGNEVAALNHDYATEYTVDVAPTCTTAGSQSIHCTRCGEADPKSVQELAPLDHDYAAEYTVDVAPTCTTAGSQSRHCTRCGEADPKSVQELAALGHNYVSKVTRAATCTEDGEQVDTCSRCGDVQKQVLKATGHQWGDWKKTADATITGAEQQQRTCVVCGAAETKAVGEKLTPTATVNASTVTLKVKQSTKGLKVTGLAKGDSVAAWKSADTKIFTVKGNADGTCTLTGKKKGSAKLEITLASGLKKKVTVKVQTAAVKTSKVTVAEKKLTVKKGEKASLKPVVTPFTSSQKLTYTSSNKKVATVSKSGVITAKKTGTAKITVKSGSKKVTVTVTVPKTKTTDIRVASSVTVKKGKTVSLNAKTTPKNSDEKLTYTSSNKKIATVTKSGKVKGVKKGTATITVKSGSRTVKVIVTVK